MSSKRKKRARDIKHNIVGYILLGLGGAFFLLIALHFDFTQDDAYITFRYAANYLNGDGLVYNIGERVEGYTNFLWTIWIILGGLAGFEFVFWSKLLGILCGLGTIVFTFLLAGDILQQQDIRSFRIFAGICALLPGTVYSFGYWAGSGLETAAFGLVVIAAIHLYLRGSLLAVPVAVLSVLVRPEGAVLILLIVAGEIFIHRRFNIPPSAVIVVSIIFLMPLAIFKLAYYSSLLPNTFYAKTSFGWEQVQQGFVYASRYFFHYLAAGLFLVPVLIVFGRHNREIRFLLLSVLLFTGYVIGVGGDVLKVHRFFVPLIPMFIICVVYGLHLLFGAKVIFYAAVVALLAWQVVVPRDYVSTYHFQETGLTDKMDRLMTELLKADRRNFSVAASTIGMAGYRLLGHTVIDLLGLTDTTIARHPEQRVEGLETTWRESRFNSGYILSRQPDYILFSTGYKPSAPAERALFMYSAFLNNYRIIDFTFEYGGDLHAVYKRYYPIRGDSRRDVDVRFVQTYNRAINLSARDSLKEALKVLDTTLVYSPRPAYPYIDYSIAELNRRIGNYDSSYFRLRRLVDRDTLVYEAYKDLYVFETMMNNEKAAAYYRHKMDQLVPWHTAEVDYLLSEAKRQHEESRGQQREMLNQ